MEIKSTQVSNQKRINYREFNITYSATGGRLAGLAIFRSLTSLCLS